MAIEVEAVHHMHPQLGPLNVTHTPALTKPPANSARMAEGSFGMRPPCSAPSPASPNSDSLASRRRCSRVGGEAPSLREGKIR